ncbi:MAG: sugar ABC transporter permease [Clostridia bacterium]|nr:sugar ABC transporter permease [Clostridia bacterium]
MISKKGINIHRFKKSSSSIRELDWQLHMMVALPILFIIVFSIIPMFGIRLAFVDKYIYSKGIWHSEWGGLKWFKYMFQMPEFWAAFKNTLIIACSKLVFGLPVPIIVSLLLNEMQSVKVKKIIQTLIYLPYFLSWVLLAGIIKDLFQIDGVFDRLVTFFGGTPKIWLQDNTSFVPIIIISDIWKGFGFGTIIYLAGLTNVDKNLYEAAEIDGANRWIQTLKITIPTIMPVIVMNLILNLGSVVNAGFDQILVLYSPKVYPSADIIDTLVYRITLQSEGGGATNYPLGAAIGLFKSVISLILIGGGNLIMTKTSDYRIF